MKRFWLILTVLCALALLMTAQAASRTQDEAVQWANQRCQEGWNLDYDGANGCQDIDLIKYYFDYLGVPRLNGYASAYVNAALPSGWTRSFAPRVGDVAVWGANVGIAGQYGHVGIVVAVNGSNIRYVATNDGAVQCTQHTVNRYNCSIYLHPVFLTYAYLDLNWRVDGQDVDGEQSAATADVYINGSLAANDCRDYYDQVPAGAKYEIKDVRASSGYLYTGVVSGSLSGTVSGTTSVRLGFEKQKSSGVYGDSVVITGASVPVRAQADMNSKKLGTVSANSVWTYRGLTYADSRGVNWYAIDYYGQAGWVSSKLSALKTDSSSYGYGDIVTIVNGNTNIRREPGLSGQLLGVAYKGSQWTYMGESSVDGRGMMWYKISYKDGYAWISSKYTEMTSSSDWGYDPWDSYTGSTTVTQSAYLVSNTPLVDGAKAFDGDTTTCWCVREYNYSFGQWVQADYSASRTVSGFTIVNGYDKVKGSNDYWLLNSRVSNLAVYCDGAYVGTFKLSDTRYPQTVSFSWPVTGKSFRFVIRGAYAGNKYQDVCISEIALN
ncbi:MAG: SH3 domain-containing protein [Clostridia bacterium]|nr:SH3 domain-containing protein [Clostridia bacterium]